MSNLIDNQQAGSKTGKIAQWFSRGTPQRRIEVFLFILIALIPFSIRHVFNSPWNFQTGAYSDFTSLSIYLSDIILVLLISAVWITDIHFKFSTANPQNSGQLVPKLWKWGGLLLILWLLFELFLSTSLPLQIYFSVRLIFLVTFAATVAKIKVVPREKIAWLFTTLGFLQAVIAGIQFYTQKSVGLYRLGESHLSPVMFGVAKIVSQQGTTLIRGYGTFPHSNLLSAFLVTAILFNLYLLTKTIQAQQKRFHGVVLYIFLFCNIFGLFLTFSRGGIIAFLASTGGLLTVFLINKGVSVLKWVIVPCGTAILISILILAPFLSTRTTLSDTATKERVFYNEVGIKMVKDKPVFGLGAGISVLHMKQYSQEDLNPWEIQPIHNFYLISWAELGVGAILLLFIIVFPIYLLFKKVLVKLDYWQMTLLAISGAFLLLFFLDHYFYTIWPTQLLLWLILGLVIRECSTWNTQAGESPTTNHKIIL